MKAFFFIIFVFIFNGSANRLNANNQNNENFNGKVSGIIIDAKTNEPLEFANVSIYRTADSSFISGILSDQDGRFLFDKLPKGVYYLIVQLVGYKKCYFKGLVLDDKCKSIELQSIKIEESEEVLDEVVIQSDNHKVEMKLDKKILNVSQEISAAGGTAIDVLQGSSMVKVDMNGDALLRNSSNFVVMIDGRQSPLSGSDALRQVPANIIEKIEMITNPSARYNAEGMSGIINIITKKQKTNGASGQINASYSSNSSYSSDFMINMKTEKITTLIGADLKENIYIPHFDFHRRYNLNDTIFFNHKMVDQTGKRPSHNLKIGFEFNLSGKDFLSLMGTYGSNDFHKIKTVKDKWGNETKPGEDFTINHEKYDVDGYYIKPALYFQHKFRDKGNELDMDVTYTYVYGGFNQNSKDYLANENFEKIDFEPHILQTENSYIKDFIEAKGSYKLDLNKTIKFEIGISTSILRRSVSTSFQNYDYLISDWTTNLEYSNDMVFDQKIYAGYMMFSGELKKIEYQLGLRGEYTDYLLDQEETTENIEFQKLHFFPTIHLSKKISETFQIQASYSRRIQRPVDVWLNPYPSSMSSGLINIGNPSLIPDITDSYELNFSKEFKRFSISINNYYRYTDNAITQVSRINDKGIYIMTMDNVNLNRFAGSEISMEFASIKWLKLNPSIDLFYLETRGEIDDFQANYSAFTYSARLNTTIDFSKNSHFQINGEYNGKALIQQGYLQPYYVVTVSYKQEFLKKKLSLVIQAKNLFRSGVMDMDENGNDFYNTVLYKPETNLFVFNLSYKINNFKRNSRIQQNTNVESF